MSQPRLTIVIPTFNRPDLLPRAVKSARRQSIPCRIIISDNGDTDKTEALIYEHKWDDVTHIKTIATYAWPNWRAGAEAADTEFVAWLQDDDKVRACYAERIITAFDEFPDADAWLARLQCAPDGRTALWYLGNGPWVPMDLMDGQPSLFAEGSILTSTAYLTSWALSPAVAYRNGPRFRSALRAMPEHCDIFVERLMPAMVVEGRSFIADPIIAGYWIQHVDNLSTKLHKDQPAQTVPFLQELDRRMEALPGWQTSLAAWCQIVPATHVIGWIGQLEVTCREGGGSRYRDEITMILLDSLKGRVRWGWKKWWLKRAVSWVKGRAAWVNRLSGKISNSGRSEIINRRD